MCRSANGCMHSAQRPRWLSAFRTPFKRAKFWSLRNRDASGRMASTHAAHSHWAMSIIIIIRHWQRAQKDHTIYWRTTSCRDFKCFFFPLSTTSLPLLFIYSFFSVSCCTRLCVCFFFRVSFVCVVGFEMRTQAHGKGNTRERETEPKKKIVKLSYIRC